jgi:hypothetical protein
MALKQQQILELERKLGRPLSLREILYEEVDRRDTRTVAEKIGVENFRPVAAKATGGTHYDDALAEAEAEARAESLRNMSPAERRVAMLRQARAEAVAKQAKDEAHQKYLATPAVASRLQKLQTLKAQIKWDPDWTVEQQSVIDAAIAQIEYGPGGDMAVADELYSKAFKINHDKKQTMRAAVAEKISHLELQKNELDRLLSQYGSDGAGEYDEAREQELWQKFQGLDESDEAGRDAARKEWADEYNKKPQEATTESATETT